MVANVKLKKRLSKFVLISGLFMIILSILLDRTTYLVISFCWLLIVIIYFIQFVSIKKRSSKLEANKRSRLFNIEFDGKNAFLYQNINKEDRVRSLNHSDFINCFKKKYVVRPLGRQEYRIFMNEMQLIEDFLTEHPGVHLETFTHGEMATMLRRRFDLSMVKAGKLNRIHWMLISVQARGVVLEKPNDFATYQISLL